MKKSLLFIAIILFIINGLVAQVDLTKPIPIDPAVKIGKLDNGMVYYIRKNTMPPNRMELRLVVNAGSILEDEDQQGLAHFVEHMAFNGTRNFSKSALVNFLERVGVRFGPDLNAYTSFDETVYMLQLPTDRTGLVDSAFMVLEDWAHQLSLEGEEIDKERGVIREEWRLGLGADDRMRKKYFPVIFKDSRYADRLPIGKIGVIDTASYETLRSFYHEWYRPDLQAIVVVGDIDPAVAEQKIISHFGSIRNPENVRERITYGVPENQKPLVAITTDKEATNTSVMLFYKHEKKPNVTLEDYKRDLMQGIYSGMIINRLNEINLKPESPFIYAYTYYGGFMGRAMDAYTSYAMVKENQIENAISTLVKENERVRQHGFTLTEFERQKKQIITQLEKKVKEKDKTNSANFVREYTSHFLSDEPIPGVENELELTLNILPLISLEAINEQASKWITDKNMVAVVTVPEREGIAVPDEEILLNTITQAKIAEVEPYEDSFSDDPLLDTDLVGSKLTETKKMDELGVTEYVLDNGIKVVLKPTTFKNDEILLTAFGPGGSSVFEDDLAFAAANVSRAISVSGIGKFSSVDLGKKLTGQNVIVQPFIEDVRQGFKGSASPKDFETMLQLTYLYFNGARRDIEAFDAFKSQLVNQFKFMKSNPQMVFADTLGKLSTSQSKRSVIIPSEENLSSLKPELIYDMFDQLFASAKGYTFIFTGNIDPETTLPLLGKYLGSLPVNKDALKWIDRDIKFPEGLTDAKVYAGSEYKSLVAIMMRNDFDWDTRSSLELNLLMKAFNIKLRETMREDLGGVYGVGARQSTRQFPIPEVKLTINWGTNPEMVDTLSKVVFNEMNVLIESGPTDDDLAKVKETSIRERESNDKQNNFWNSYLDFSYFNQNEMQTYEAFRDAVNAVTVDDLRMQAKKYFTLEKYLRLVLYPEELNE